MTTSHSAEKFTGDQQVEAINVGNVVTRAINRREGQHSFCVFLIWITAFFFGCISR